MSGDPGTAAHDPTYVQGVGEFDEVGALADGESGRDR